MTGRKVTIYILQSVTSYGMMRRVTRISETEHRKTTLNVSHLIYAKVISSTI